MFLYQLATSFKRASRRGWSLSGVGYFSSERGFSVESSLQCVVEFLVVETKWFAGSSVNVILTQPTCGQRSNRAAESKRRALEKHYSERISHMFLISKCRGDWDLGLCTFWALAKRKPLRNAKFRFFLRAIHVFFESRQKSSLRSGFLFVYRTTDESFRFHNKEFDEMRCKLDSTENPRSFDKYPTPQGVRCFFYHDIHVEK